MTLEKNAGHKTEQYQENGKRRCQRGNRHRNDRRRGEGDRKQRDDRHDDRHGCHPAETRQRMPRKDQKRLDDDEIQQDLEDARQPVFRLSELSCVVTYADLGHACPHRDRHRRDETVHVRIERHPADDLRR